MHKDSSRNLNHILYLTLMILGMGLSFGKWILFSTSLTPTEFGLYTSIITTISFLAFFGAFGLNELIIKDGSKLFGIGNTTEIHILRDSSLLFSIISSSVVILISINILQFFLPSEFPENYYLISAAILLTTVIFNITDASLRAMMNALSFAAMVFIRSLSLLLIGFACAKTYGVFGILLAEFISAFVAIIYGLIFVGPKPKINIQSILLIKNNFLQLGSSFLGLQIFRYFSFTADKWIIAWLANTYVLGVYSFLLVTFLAFVAFCGIYNAVVIPKMIAKHSTNGDSEALLKVINKQVLVLASILILFMPFYTLVANFLVSNFLAKYHTNEFFLCLSIIYVASILHVIHQFYDAFFYSINRQFDLTLLAGLSTGIFITLFLISGLINPTILFFCLSFLAGKVFLILCTITRVLIIHHKTLVTTNA